MAARPWTPQEDGRLRELHGQGIALHTIARTMGRSKDTISRKAHALGLSWSRERTANAAHAVAVDNKARRQALMARLYGQVETELDRLDQGNAGRGWQTILKGEYGAEDVRELEFVPPRDRREISDTINRYLTAVARMEQLDQDATAGAERSLLRSLGEALGVTGPAA